MKAIAYFFIIVFLTNCIVYGDEININAKSAVLTDRKTGRILWKKNESEPMAMASTTKIMTAVLAIEKGNENDIVRVSKRASIAPKVKMYLKENEEIRLGDLLYALMMQSSNDAAVAIAEHISGSVENFCGEMTAKAKEIGCKDTLFVTPNGLDMGEHHSTAEDMAKITRYALGNKKFVQIINTKIISFKSSKTTYNITNKNRLLSEYEGCYGVKTGFTGKAGHCFVGAAKRNGIDLISVVLASGWGNSGKEKKWSDTKKLLNYGFENFEYRDIIKKGDKAGNINIEGSREKKTETEYAADFVLCIKKDNSDNIRTEKRTAKTLQAPVKKGDITGECIIYCNGEEMGRVNIVACENIERFDFQSNLIKIIKKYFMLAVR